MIQVKRAIVIGLGEDGAAASQQLSSRIRSRHDGSVAWVQVFNITYEGDVSFTQSQDEHVTHMVLRPRQLDSSERRPSWLPEGAESGDEPARALGRLTLHQNAAAIQARLQAARNRISNKTNTGPLTMRGLEESDPSVIHLIFTLNVADPLASGMLLDMAYLGRKAIAGSQCWALLMMPEIFAQYRAQLSQGGAVDNAALAQDALANARAYAALKELDYYMDTRISDIFSSSYTGAGGIGPIESTRQVPFEHVYLIGERNRASLSLSSAQDAAAMLGEWMYQVLFTPIGTRLITGASKDIFEGKVSSYSSLGLSYAYVPGEELLNYVSNRLALQIVNERLLNNPPTNESLAPSNLTATFRSQNALQLTELRRNLLQLDGEWLNDYSRVQIANFDVGFTGLSEILVYEADLTEQRVVEQYNERLESALPKLEEHLYNRMRRKMQEFVPALEREWNYQLDSENDGEGGAPLRTRTYFNYVISELRKEQEEVARQTEKAQKDLAGMGNVIRRQRTMYRLAANGFGSIPLFKETPLPIFLWHARYTLGLFVVLGLLAYYSYRFVSETLRGGLWGLAPALGIVAIAIAMAIYTFRWLQASRDKLIDSYQLRLRIERGLAVLRHAGQFYAFAIQQISHVLEQTQEFIQDLESARASLARNLTPEMKARILTNADEGLAEMVLSDEDMERFYSELVTDDISPIWRRLKMEKGEISTWRGNPDKEPFEMLRSFSRSFLQKMSEHSIDEILVRRDEMTLRSMLLRMRAKASPFWEIERGREPSLPEPYCLIGIPDVDRPSAAPLKKLAETLDHRDPMPMSTNNDKQIIFVGNQSGVPLFAVTSVMALRDDYQLHMAQGLASHLHLSKGSLLIPDLESAGENMVELLEPYSGKSSTPQLITALALALGLITEKDGCHQFSFVDEDARLIDIDRRIEIGLGPTKEAATTYFYDHSWHLDILRDQVRNALDNIAGFTHGTGVPDVDHLKKINTFIDNHLHRPPAPLEDWEEVRLRSFYEGVAGKLRAHLAVTDSGKEDAL